MGFWSDLLARYSGGTAMLRPRVTYLSGMELGAFLADPSKYDAAKMWRSQPHFRTVVSFIARNTAQLGLHVFERQGDSRVRDRTSPLAALMSGSVDTDMTGYELMYATVVDMCLYDRAYWMVSTTPDTASGYRLRRLPPSWVEQIYSDPWTVKTYRVYAAPDKYIDVPADNVLAFPGYHPRKPSGESPVVEALRDTLLEQVEAHIYRRQVWKRGGRVSAVIQRPADAPEWSDNARERFKEDWHSKFTGNGPGAGGTPLLEDGMTVQRIDFNAQEQQFVEAAKLSMVTVASAYHINPTMVGQNEGANYSNVREFRKMLYGETLGPLLAQLEARVNAYLLPMLGMDPQRYYAEFNIEEKLQGNFEEQAAALQTAVGGPWMTRAEARSLRNLPTIDGADELIVPMNVTEGGLASPNDTAPKALFTPSAAALTKADPVRVKAEPREEDADAAAAVLRAFFKRQRGAVLSRLGAKSPDWWDEERWNEELADDLYDLALKVVADLGPAAMAQLGLAPDAFDTGRTEAFLREVAKTRAGAINSTTMQQVQDALEGNVGDDAERSTPEGVFDVAEESRASLAGVTLATTLTAFAYIEAGKQAPRPGVTKTWVVTSANPRQSHAAMNGETVGIDETFSNGMDWPGDARGGVDEVANCSCTCELSVPS